MSILNEKNETTEKVIHLMVTSLCSRNCEFCCNKQYSLDDVPYVTDEELRKAEVLCITGGEPFEFCDPCNIAFYYRSHYHNIKKIYVYTNAYELSNWLESSKHGVYAVDGLNISIKSKLDLIKFKQMIVNDKSVMGLTENQVYVFNDLLDEKDKEKYSHSFTIKDREWQREFVPAPDSIFRKV